MVSLTVAGVIGTSLLSIVAWFKWQAYRAEQQAVEFAEKNAKLEQENKAQKKVIKSVEIKQKNQENSNRISVSSVDEQLHKHGWFRDDSNNGV